MTGDFRIRKATEADMPAVYRLVHALAVYEKLADRMTAGEADLREALFGKQPRIEAALAETTDGGAVGIAIFYENFATFTCTPGFYLEDLYVDEAARGAGIGKALIAWGAARALERGCARYQWVVLDWNKPARDFYRSLGAEETPEWIGVRVAGDALKRLAAGKPAAASASLDTSLAVDAHGVPFRAKRSNYPEPFYSRMAGRAKRVLGDLFDLKNFGVNMTTLAPGGESSLLHRHSRQDEFVFVVSGSPTLVTDKGEVQLHAGMCAGFPAGGCAHQIVNRSDGEAVYLEIGDRTPGDGVEYPVDDLQAKMGADGNWVFGPKDRG
jgi:uncharacterized cupin superfamily protein/GNAT superfamily N-acetyltransferase